MSCGLKAGQTKRLFDWGHTVEIHFREPFVDLLEDLVDLARVHEVLKDSQHGAQLLMLLLDAQLLVHAVHSLFKAGLEG